MFSCTVGKLVQTLPKGEPVDGVTSLSGEVYVLREKERDQVEVYDVVSYRLQRCLTLPNAREFNDMTSCEHNRCMYIGDHIHFCIHRLGAQGAATRWPVNDTPVGLSTNAAHNLLVACRNVHKIKEFSSHGDLIRELTLPVGVINPWHSIQTRSGQFIVSHGRVSDAVHRVCKVSEDGRQVVQFHGRQKGSSIGQYNVPTHLAVDDNEFAFVADVGNRRVTLLSPTLGYIREVVCRDHLKWLPLTLCLDTQRRRLYVAVNEFSGGEFTAGRVLLFSV